MVVGQNTTFTDPGATAADSGVDVTSSIVTTGTVDTTTLGTYTKTYTYTDAGGLFATQARTVVVVPASLAQPTEAEVTDYYPYGGQRFDTGSYNSQRKYIGEYYDTSADLSFLNARYYEGPRGQFLLQDPVFWEIGQTRDGKAALSDPQSMNSYSYAGNNPINKSDPTGRWYKEFFWGNLPYTATPGQSWSSFYGEVGEAAGYLGQQSPAWNYAMNNPYTTGPAVGVGSGAVAYGGAAGLTYLSGQYLGGLGTACLAFCGTVGQQATRYADTISKGVTNPKLVNIINNVYQSTDKLPGGTFGAVRNEIITGQPTGGTFHFTKMMDTLNGIGNVLKSGNVSQGDLKAIQTLINNAAKAVAEAAKALK